MVVCVFGGRGVGGLIDQRSRVRRCVVWVGENAI